MLTFHVHFVVFLLQLRSLEISLLIFWAELIEFYRHKEDDCTEPSNWGKQSITLVRVFFRHCQRMRSYWLSEQILFGISYQRKRHANPKFLFKQNLLEFQPRGQELFVGTVLRMSTGRSQVPVPGLEVNVVCNLVVTWKPRVTQ